MKKNDLEKDKIKNYELFLENTRNIRKEQMDSYDKSKTIAGIMIPIIALMITFIITRIIDFELSLCLKLLPIISVCLLVLSFFFLIKILMPKGILYGFKYEKYKELENISYEKLVKHVLKINEDNRLTNEIVIQKQYKNFKYCIWSVSCTIITLVIFMILRLLSI